MSVSVLKAVLCRRHEEDRPGEDRQDDEERQDDEDEKLKKSTIIGTRSKKLKKKVSSILGGRNSRCACCLKPLAHSRIVACCDCGAWTCKKKCSRLDDQRHDWCCLFCYQQRAWLQSNNPRWINGLEIQSDNGARSLDTTPTETDLLLLCADNGAADARSAVYAAIRKLVDHAVDEVHQKLPNSDNNDANQDVSVLRKNQDNLLATVIVNKVIAKCQSEQTANGSLLNLKRVADNNFFASEADPVDGQSQSCDRSLELLHPTNLQAVSVASKFTQTQPPELSSLMYEERIEEVAAYVSEKYISSDSYDDLDFCNSHRVPFPELGIDIVNQYYSDIAEDDEDDGEIDSSYVKTLSLPHSWKENWYFRKRSSEEATRAAVSMFVPNSKADYRALIGDKDIDETSELSEYSTYSDDEEEVDTELVLTMKNSLGNNDADKALKSARVERDARESHDVSAAAKSISKRNEDKLFSRLGENNATITEDENFNFSLEPSYYSSSSLQRRNEIPEKPLEFQEDENKEIFKEDQRDRECSEHNTLVPRRRCNGMHDNANISVSKPADAACSERENTQGTIDESVARVEDDLLVDDINLFAPPIPGSIADREHKKWLNAAPIENNPYSQENIEKRLVQRRLHSPAAVLSSCDMTINGNDFHALEAEDKPVAPSENTTAALETNKEKHREIPVDVDEAHNKDKSQSASPAENQDSRNKSSDYSKIPEDSRVLSKARSDARNPRKSGQLSNTQLIKSYFEKGERKENSRDASPIKSQKISNNSVSKVKKKKKKTLESHDSFEAISTAAADDNTDADKIIALPSVKKIVQAFNEKIQDKSSCNLTAQKSSASKSESGDEEREIQVASSHIRRTPKQLHLHSLTARSLSREFREGLRQVPKKA